MSNTNSVAMPKRKFSQKPFKMWIDGSSFSIERDKHKNIVKSPDESEASKFSGNLNPQFIITPTIANKLVTSFRLPYIYYINLHKLPEFSLQQLEAATNTEIFVPKTSNDGHITISSSDKSNIIKSRESIHSALAEIRERLKPLQFTSIPVTSEEVKKSFELFKESVLNDGPIKGVDASIFQSPLKLHLTLNVFSLSDDIEKGEAVLALIDCKKEIIDPLIANGNNLKIRVAGLGCMTDNYTNSYVLYANANFVSEVDENSLQNVVNSVSDYFYERGLVKQYRDTVKLHVTLLNSRYRKSLESSPAKSRSKWALKKQSFDATKIMEKYKDYYFGESVFDTINISYMSSIGEDGFYKPLATVNF